MRIRDYIKDQLPIIFGWLLFVGLTGFILWLTPGFAATMENLLYVAGIQLVILLAFLAYYYYYKNRWWKKLQISEAESTMQNYMSGARTKTEQLQQDYINQVIREHQTQIQEIVAAQEEQKDYIDSWVHEIKVPLAASQLLLRSIEFDIPDEKFIQLENELNKMDGYVEQVMYVARLDNFSKDYLIENTPLKAVILPVIRSNANYFIQKQLRYQVVGEDQTVLTDGKWISFILQQIISNAIKYTPEKGEITISLTGSDEGVLLSVADTGIGIPSEDLRRIFDKGFTGRNGRFSEMHSTGLGLYLAYNLAQQLGVRLTVASQVGKGTTVGLFFPYLSYYQEKM